jgi:hypothetical protein
MVLAHLVKGSHENVNFGGAASLVFRLLLLEIAAK